MLVLNNDARQTPKTPEKIKGSTRTYTNTQANGLPMSSRTRSGRCYQPEPTQAQHHDDDSDTDAEEEDAGEDACFICGATTPDHEICPPHGNCPTCDEVVCYSCWWTYSVTDDMCIFCGPDRRPMFCECEEVEACECLEQAKRGVRGHYPKH